MYYVIIEPVYGQGVGHYEMITNEKQHIDMLRQKLFTYANNIKLDKSFNVCEWKFVECVYRINKIIENVDKDEVIYKMTNIFDNEYNFNIKKLKKINWDYEKGKDHVVEVDYDNKMELDVVYNCISDEIIPTNIYNFNIDIDN